MDFTADQASAGDAGRGDAVGVAAFSGPGASGGVGCGDGVGVAASVVASAGPVASGGVGVADVDVGSLSEGALVERLELLGRERCRVEGLLAEVAAELHSRLGGRAASAVMRERLNVSSRQATADTQLAVSLAEGFSETLAAWQAGEITAGHARVIARVGADPDHEPEPELLKMARDVPVDLFARMTRRYERDCADFVSECRRQHENRWASLVQDPDGSWRLNAYFGYDTGKRVSVAFNQMARAYRSGTGVGGIRITGLTGPQRRADALANLITGEGPHRRPDATLLVVADYDTVTEQLRGLRYDDGLPVSHEEVARLAARAKILPAFFDTDGDPLWLGRAHRDASTGQRLMLAARDGGCVNCASPAEGCEPHHVEWYSRGGPTDIDNLALLCESCHHLVHDDGWPLRRHNGRHRLHPPAPLTPRGHPPAPASAERNPILRT